jgi:DNA-binding response OmpR family regulator
VRELAPAGTRGIAISDLDSESDVQRSRGAGFKLHLTKPVGIKQVLEAIDSITHHS